MKFFTEIKAEDIMNEMQENLVKNASPSEFAFKERAISLLIEAAEIYESANNDEKALELTQLVAKVANLSDERAIEINAKITELEDGINSLSEFEPDEINSHFLRLANKKISDKLSTLSNTQDIKTSLNKIKESYIPNNTTLKAISESLEIANGTIGAVDKKKA